MKKTILTGDRPTGPLHLGHYVGSLKNRVKLQDEYNQFVMIADVQALTDNYHQPEVVGNNIMEVLADYLAIGIDPKKTTIFIQSQIPELFEITTYFLNLVSVSRLERNPTIKAEIAQKKFKSIPVGFLAYPVSQSADILGFKANLVPVGEEQRPMIEQANEIGRSFNKTYNSPLFPEVQSLIGEVGRLPGIDGKQKMSKSLGNAVHLSDNSKEVKRKVQKMYTDPGHLRVEDPGKVEGNSVFTFLDAFDPDRAGLEAMKAHYQRGGLGDGVVKKHLVEVLENFLSPIREKRQSLVEDRSLLQSILCEGNAKAKDIVSNTLHEMKNAMKIDYDFLK